MAAREGSSLFRVAAGFLIAVLVAVPLGLWMGWVQGAFRTFNPIVSVTNVENAQYSTRLLAATTLRNILGTRTLQEILQDKENIAHHMQVRIHMKHSKNST